MDREELKTLLGAAVQARLDSWDAERDLERALFVDGDPIDVDANAIHDHIEILASCDLTEIGDDDLDTLLAKLKGELK